jgi:hypothetical protein
MSRRSRGLKLPEPQEPHQACSGKPLPLLAEETAFSVLSPLAGMKFRAFNCNRIVQQVHIANETANPLSSSNWDTCNIRQLGYKHTSCKNIVSFIFI